MENNIKKNNPCKQDKGNVLLVEGSNDCHVVMALCKAYNLPNTFGIYECGGDDGVLMTLDPLIIREDNLPQIIGIILDVDASEHTLESRWQSIKDTLRHHNYSFPIAPNINGTIVEGEEDKPKLGFWFMPNNQDCGMLEDFCAELAEPSSLAFARECVEQAQLRELTTFNNKHLSKAVIHTYLAWQDEPGYPLGKSITSQALRSHNSNIALSFTDWLLRLFS